LPFFALTFGCDIIWKGRIPLSGIQLPSLEVGPIIRTVSFDREQGIRSDVAPDSWKESGEKGVIWLDLEGPGPDELKLLEGVFGFHKLNIEDAMNVRHRPKVEEYPGYTFMVMHAIVPNSPNHMGTTAFALFFGRNFVVTVHGSRLPFLDDVVARCKQNSILMERGVDFLVYTLADGLVDDYFPMLDRIEGQFARLEEELYYRPDNRTVNRIFKLRRELLELRKVLGPQRDMFNILLRLDFPFTTNETRVYFMDVYDHILRIVDLVETYRELVGGSLEVYLTAVSNRVNEVVKTLTVVATVVLPATVITGIYGMNFAFMPELRLRYGYFWALGVMAVSTVSMLIYFRRKKWI